MREGSRCPVEVSVSDMEQLVNINFRRLNDHVCARPSRDDDGLREYRVSVKRLSRLASSRFESTSHIRDWLFKATFHYAIQVADQVCDLDSVMEFGYWFL